jgi:dimethylargininase
LFRLHGFEQKQKIGRAKHRRQPGFDGLLRIRAGLQLGVVNNMITAIVNAPTESLQNCSLTHLDRHPIQFDLALQQHANYASTLHEMGARVEMLKINQESPDAVFVEDAAIVLDELAIVTSMGNAKRRCEVEAVASVLSRFRADVRRIRLPARIEGGDVLALGKTLFVGQSSRTDVAGLWALEEIVKPFGYDVRPVSVRECLHLKTGVTALDESTLVCNPKWIDVSAFGDFRLIHVDPREPWAANVLRINDRLILNGSFPRTADRIDAVRGGNRRVVISEFGKAEAGLTCMSIVFKGD